MLQLVYTIVFYLIQPFILIRLWIRGNKVPAYRKRWAERYGFCSNKIISGGIVLHSVSVGETFTAIPLIKALRDIYPILSITITTMTPTGSDLVRSILNKEVYNFYLPYDLPGSINRFLDRVKPTLVIIMETEIWPNFITLLHKRKIPIVIVNARLSVSSAKGYAKCGSFIRDILSYITLIMAQNKEDGDRFIALGLKKSQLAITGNLKCDISLPKQLAEKIVMLRRKWALQCPVWIAASTHKGEEEVLIKAHKKLIDNFPNLLFILVPRHPERCVDVIKLIKQEGLSYITRSSGNIPSNKIQVVIGDTIGELMLFYGISDIAFVGGSLVNLGGHNPLEPAAHHIPILMGPCTINFKDICAKLKKAHGLITVRDINSLVKEITMLLLYEENRNNYGRYAFEVLHQNKGALKKILHLLECNIRKIQ
ncbi:lipid IV(A) 3-deoxy-D-manno-octulosonic acid transferase [Candidatus Profftia sp. (ex Adelges kitamiensis)]|uniref:lipid IV(A) 3-deoxy-D-manno-octulosonic acid transferase n=1 Tax=Candidatus Profftia sp. (ex Adelges kitamiensis) TaxID=2864218 RepID=UPI001CE2E934|nr:lipid IV(A) 3-deoxy-D-manno-octulosonic acid transferase [Candidatus Profftia sp. (ex Adelges kitamiensis)]